MKSVSPCNDQRYAGRPTFRIRQKLERHDILGHYEYDKCQTLHDGSTLLGLHTRNTFSDLLFQGHSSVKQF